MDYKLKAISNNIDSEQIIDSMLNDNSSHKSEEFKEFATDHVCERNVPVLFTTTRGVHLRKFSKSSPNNYSIAFCDLERWVRSKCQLIQMPFH
jgi:hypothetical protein